MILYTCYKLPTEYFQCVVIDFLTVLIYDVVRYTTSLKRTTCAAHSPAGARIRALRAMQALRFDQLDDLAGCYYLLVERFDTEAAGCYDPAQGADGYT